MGRFIIWTLTVVYVGSIVLTFAQKLRTNAYGWGLQRRNILTQLQEEGGRHLVIVRYCPQHSPHKEWVYNEANIDAAQVVWAREMDTDQNHKLLAYFVDRRVWLIELDAMEPHVVPYHFGLETPCKRAGHSS
jgi:hypothetical protein